MNPRICRYQPWTLPLAMIGLVAAGALSACGGDDPMAPAPPPPAPQAASLAFSVQPATSTAGASIVRPGAGPVELLVALDPTVQILDAAGAVITSATDAVTVAIDNNAGGGTLSGTATVNAVAGVATFSGLTIEAAGTGYTLTASLGTLTATSAPFDITPDVAAQVAFASAPANTVVRSNMAAVEVEIQDQFGNLIPNSTAGVTLDLETNPGSMILHAGGFQDFDLKTLERVDPVSGFLVPLPAPGTAPRGMVLDPSTGQVFTIDCLFSGTCDVNLSTMDPATGAPTLIGTISTFNADPILIRNIAVEAGTGRLIAAGFPGTNDPNLYEIDTTTPARTLLGTLTIAGDAITRIHGLAVDPTGVVCGIVRLASEADPKIRELVAIDIATLVATSIGTMSEPGAEDLTFLPDGTMYAGTGAGQGGGVPNPTSLFSVDPATGAMTLVGAMTGGVPGQTITRVPASFSGTLASSAVGGVAAFADLQIDGPGDGFVMRATSPGLTEVLSATFNITP